MVGQTISHYKILEKIGEGGMGEVYRAEDTNLSREVAIKVLPEQFTQDPQRLARFEREVQLLASLNHPNIAAIHSFEHSDDIHFLVLELVEGDTLAERVKKGPLPVEDALEVCRQIAEGVEAAHEKGVIHRDLKPANVKVTPEGKVKVLDFGLAKAFEAEPPVTDISQSPTLIEEMTRAGVILGTAAAYMSPEQARGKPIDKRADIFAFGCVLYELLTGKRAFEGETVTETLAKILEGEPDWEVLPKNTPWNIRTLLRRCLHKDPHDRFHDIANVRIEIKAAVTEQATASPAGVTGAGRPVRWKLAIPLSVAGLIAGVMLIGLGVWNAMQPSPPASHVLAAPKHPLDSLSPNELWTVQAVMKASGHLSEESRFIRVRLHEPPKSEVLNWNPGNSFRREAFVVIRQGTHTFEAIVDLLEREVTTWGEIEGVQPPINSEELIAIQAAVKKNPDWQAAMHKRGIRDFDTVRSFASWAYPTTADEEGRRLVKVVSFDRHGVTNLFGRPIEGLVVIVDANTLEVLKVIDSGVVPIPKGPVDYDERSVERLRRVPTPISIVQPQGPSFHLNGREVSWQKWNFHFRIDPRVGLVISNVRYEDGDKLRSVLYQGSLSEIYVPYMDPDVGWDTRLYLDLAENLGAAGPLEPGLDCPNNAVFFDTVVADSQGIPQPVPRAACLFERYDGGMAWRHNDSLTDHTESRRRRDLVLRMIATFGNYDYVFDWVFQQNGTIKVAVGATGINQVKAVTSRTVKEDKEGLATRYGRFLAEHTVGVNHDHYFCFRLDLDVEGTNNSLLREELKTVGLTEGKLRKRIWVVEPKIAQTESEAMLKINLAKPSLWRLINPNVLGPLGYPVSYQIKPIDNALPLVTPEDFPQRRGAFTQYHLWVTPYRTDERYAGGAYPQYHKSEEGLPKWTRANRRIENTDIVAWYTLGFHHVVRAEDWPIMPTSWHEFELRPFDFFKRSPALDLPSQP